MKNLILGIESSCDDSSIAIINKDNFDCLFYKKISQEKEHFKFGGVVPELAARLHSFALPKILEECKDYFKDLCAIAVTNEPGLSVSLLSGISMAKVLALSLKIPLIAINHLKGHIYSLFLNEKLCFNMGILLVSGGHTMVLKLDKNGKLIILAKTSDDSFGESFDKVAKMMNLGYPGGVVIENLAKKARYKNISFSVPLKHSKECYYSFSGLKNQVRLKILSYENLDENIKSEIAYGFENAACEHILDKLEMIFKKENFKIFGVVGGASANLNLRTRLEILCKKYNCALKLAPLKYCADNALMIARNGIDEYEKKNFTPINQNILHPKNTNFTHI
ncbi:MULTISPECIES: tRNA (adenosine(37)-N6)-threonylcarbamoyltransferase complex transferase subunit TsaD [unclassified Campylobacter]|uniref:tRNA (adenosine(37)-N6)-threonylcarbamoyltransferase complex transferase subunit TsaD n=1 Tax=unclassified Campylobacter TaxID=2593542 RepID=UPI0012381AB2|nr:MULTISPECIES: tRNA (adenosine(37)-N6)-threonylcarbamoyltransferase complex transferase subunit TsaD [unclassified Campylobacter]KAA6224573.1 tRNA (adenosine(37)-N6)-threonylcarbamoyltransferase complex transferase subunit TsaD [Campylobacter sp. LR185c]KAA6224920.1 tRNA (adenosine(37)-N6)-threonylcarbamoyltransferase complex transferase subunit TsaD [Campylobacter sp. LR196d]KAA6225417.1 tRNA (adenosine(37)-N6)-threonylcarbamoyltransferase complex transferase subunit TsaD [Campylobacter sp. L